MKQLSVDPWVLVAVGAALSMDAAALAFADLGSVFGIYVTVVKFGLFVANAGLGYVALALNVKPVTPGTSQ